MLSLSKDYKLIMEISINEIKTQNKWRDNELSVNSSGSWRQLSLYKE